MRIRLHFCNALYLIGIWAATLQLLIFLHYLLIKENETLLMHKSAHKCVILNLNVSETSGTDAKRQFAGCVLTLEAPLYTVKQVKVARRDAARRITTD